MLISDGLWRRQYGADESMVGRDINVGGSPATIVGVLPPGMLPRTVDIWISTAGLAEGAPDLGVLKLVGRLRSGVTLDAARANLTVVAAGLAREQPAGASLGAQVVPLSEQIYGQTEPALRLLVAAVACLLLIACANVANLLLARGVDREREFAVRAATGASGRRLASQLFGESLVLGLLGGAAGVLIATWTTSLVRGLIPGDVPGIDRLAIDWRVLAVALTLGANRAHVVRLVLRQAVVLTGLGVVAGLAVALAGSRGLAGLLYEISPTGPFTLAGAVALLAAVGIGGGLLASRRALSVDPAIALREE